MRVSVYKNDSIQSNHKQDKCRHKTQSVGVLTRIGRNEYHFVLNDGKSVYMHDSKRYTKQQKIKKHVLCGQWEITSSSMTESVPLLMPAKITGLLVVVLVLLLLLVPAFVNDGVKVPFGPRPNINEVARSPATFDTSPEIAAHIGGNANKCMQNDDECVLHLQHNARVFGGFCVWLCTTEDAFIA